MATKTKKRSVFRSQEHDLEIIVESTAQYDTGRHSNQIRRFRKTFTLSRPKAGQSITLQESELAPGLGGSIGGYVPIRYNSYLALNDAKILASGMILVADFALYHMRGDHWDESNEITFKRMVKLIVELEKPLSAKSIVAFPEHRPTKSNLGSILPFTMGIH